MYRDNKLVIIATTTWLVRKNDKIYHALHFFNYQQDDTSSKIH